MYLPCDPSVAVHPPTTNPPPIKELSASVASPAPSILPLPHSSPLRSFFLIFLYISSLSICAFFYIFIEIYIYIYVLYSTHFYRFYSYYILVPLTNPHAQNPLVPPSHIYTANFLQSFIYICIYISTYVSLHIFTFLYIYILYYMYIYIHRYLLYIDTFFISNSVFVFLYFFFYTYIYLYIYSFFYIFTYFYIAIYMYMYVYS